MQVDAVIYPFLMRVSWYQSEISQISYGWGWNGEPMTYYNSLLLNYYNVISILSSQHSIIKQTSSNIYSLFIQLWKNKDQTNGERELDYPVLFMWKDKRHISEAIYFRERQNEWIKKKGIMKQTNKKSVKRLLWIRDNNGLFCFDHIARKTTYQRRYLVLV